VSASKGSKSRPLCDALQVVDVAAGGWHSVFVTRPGELFACGDNRHGQLGLGHKETIALPARSTVVGSPFPGSGPKDVAFAKAAAGQFHTLLLTQVRSIISPTWH
jgi:alpha-tubulin suppressor-like RCC1 family protein